MKAKFRLKVQLRGLVEPTGLPEYLNNENFTNANDLTSGKLPHSFLSEMLQIEGPTTDC